MGKWKTSIYRWNLQHAKHITLAETRHSNYDAACDWIAVEIEKRIGVCGVAININSEVSFQLEIGSFLFSLSEESATLHA
jgi:hypothetical protein